MSYELTTGDRYIVDTVNAEFTGPDALARARQIYADSLEVLRPQLEALERAVALREYALAQLDRIEVQS